MTTANDTQQEPAESLSIHAPERSSPDEEIRIRISGAPPAETVEFETSMTDSDGGSWRSQATFRADDDGVVNLAAQPPDCGTYEGTEPMGWLWSMRAEDDEQLVTELADTAPKTVELRASAGNETAERTIERSVEGAEITQTDVEIVDVDLEGVEAPGIETTDLEMDSVPAANADTSGGTMDRVVGTVFTPADAGPHPGILVLHGSGCNRPVWTAALLASHGFTAFALQYAGDHEALPGEVVRVPLPYFEAAAEWLCAQESVGDGSIGVVGHSRGGEIGLVLGARYDWAGAVVSYAGSTVRWDTPWGEPAWVDADGEPLPYISGQGKPTLCEGQLDEASAETRAAATIPVEEIDGPVLFISGAADPVWPARRLANIGMERLDEANVGHEYDHQTEDEAGHFITPPYLPKSTPVFGGTPAGMARVDAAAWPNVLSSLSAGAKHQKRL